MEQQTNANLERKHSSMSIILQNQVLKSWKEHAFIVNMEIALGM